MIIGSLNQLWAVGALISLVVVVYLGLMILRENDDKKIGSSLNSGSTATSAKESSVSDSFSASSPSPPPPPGREVTPPPPGQEVIPPDLSGGSND